MRSVTRYNRLTQLPLGSVRPAGWLLEQLRRNKEGLGGHLPELEPRMIATPYTTRETEPRWGKERCAGWGAEISGNYYNGLVELAFTLDDAELKEKATAWVETVLKNQRPDGYMGTYRDGDDFFDDYNAWGTACGMKAMLSYFSATGRRDVLDAVHRCMLWFCENWAGDKKTRYGGVSIVSVMSECYLHTGDERLLRFCEDYYDFLERHDLFDKSLSAYLAPRLFYNANHGAGYAEAICHPLEVYLMNGDPRYLAASENACKKAQNKVVQKTGGITCETEYLAPVGATVETEYCAIAMYNESLGKLLYTTGDPAYADEMEKAVFNAGEGARKKDEKAIAYLHSPNQIFATDRSAVAGGKHQVYAPCVPTACCPVMSVRLLPEFLRNAVLTDENGDLYIAAYMPCRIQADDMEIEAQTEYPFRDTIAFRIHTTAPVEKTLHFRIPDWCDAATLTVNGKKADVACSSKTFAALTRSWQEGDVVTLTLPMTVRIEQVNDADRSAKFPLAVFYGPLLFALPIPEQWNAWEGKPYTPLPEGWHWYNVEPVLPPSGLDVYDDMGMRKFLISWNVALDEDITPDQVTPVFSQTDAYPWEEPPVRLTLPGFKAPYSYAPYATKTFEPAGDGGRVYVTDPLTLTLVPFGCTALRISYFPRAEKQNEKE